MDLFLDFIQIFRRIMIILAQNKVCFCFSLHCLLNKSVISRKKNVHVNVSWFVPSCKALGFQLLSWKVLEKLLNKSESYVLKESSCTLNLRHFIVTSVQISCFECVTQHPTSHEHWCLITLCLISWVTNYYTTTTTWEISLIWLVKSSGITA